MRWVALVLLSLLPRPALAQSSPRAVAQKVYAWSQKYTVHADDHLGEVKPLFTVQLYESLRQAYARNANREDFLDFDPFSNSQIGADRISCGEASIRGSQASLPVTVVLSHRGGTTYYTLNLVRQGDAWRISNFTYPNQPSLLETLQQYVNKKK